MLVQPITTNTNYNNVFKAKIINDSKGHLRKLWQDAVLDTELSDMIDKFSKKNKKHSLEITNVVFNEKRHSTTYSIFNHRNGFGLTIEAKNSPGFVLHEILNKIADSQLLSETNSRTASIYKKLTGQK